MKDDIDDRSIVYRLESNKTLPEIIGTADSFGHFVNFIFNDSKLTRFQPCVYVWMDIWIDIWIDSNQNLHWIF